MAACVINVVRRTPSRDQFLDWAEAQSVRHEFDGFEPVAMTGTARAALDRRAAKRRLAMTVNARGHWYWRPWGFSPSAQPTNRGPKPRQGPP